MCRSSSAYDLDTGYDAAGRVATLTYPSVTINSVASRFAVKNVYNASGYLAEIRNNATNALYWQGNAANADLSFTQETLGNNAVTARTFDAATGRLTGVGTTSSGGATIQQQGFAYDRLGNIT